uniref:Uncharacterized protein n=1 Tax=viral metagenome TaxID=1070528 RepID=A0A6C0LXJ1_9ZZZZ
MNSNENKQMLWELLRDNKAFDGFSNTQYQKVIQTFNTTMTTIGDVKSTNPLIEQNKIFISEMMSRLQTIKSEPETTPKNDAQLLTRDEIQTQKRNEFEKNLERRQQEFTKYMDLHIPDDIDFSDKKTEEPIQNVDTLIHAKMKERSYDSILVNDATSYDVSGVVIETIKAETKTKKAIINNTDEDMLVGDITPNELTLDYNTMNEEKQMPGQMPEHTLESLNKRIIQLETMQRTILDELARK